MSGVSSLKFANGQNPSQKLQQIDLTRGWLGCEVKFFKPDHLDWCDDLEQMWVRGDHSVRDGVMEFSGQDMG